MEKISSVMKKENFWEKIERPFYVLAPMEDVTDTVFREVIMRVSEPKYLNVLFAEFTSIDGMLHEVGHDRVVHRLFVNDSERKLLKERGTKIVAQIWGSDPEKFYKAAKMINEQWDFDGIDINMGCPVKKIVKQASCSQLIKFPELAKEIILATKEGSEIPVSVKTRTGIKEHETERWIPQVLETKPAALTLHGRTQKMMSDYPAEWDEIGRMKQLRDELAPEVFVLGNGDLMSVPESKEKMEKYGIDGVMVGRGIFSNPWLFNEKLEEKSAEEKMRLLWFHVSLFMDTWNGTKNFPVLKRFFKIYTSNFHGASELRQKFMMTENPDDVRRVIEESPYNIFSEEPELAE
jgi:nifR3 family TIM-barrel protein